MCKHHKQHHESDIKVRDPVCKMNVSLKTATDELEFFGQKFYFCSPNCRFEFELDPDKYLPSTKDFR